MNFALASRLRKKRKKDRRSEFF